MIVMFMSLFAFALRAVTEVSYNQNSKNSTDDMKDMSQNERLEKLKNEYINGDLSEEEFERMVDLELSGPTEEEIEFSHEFNRI